MDVKFSREKKSFKDQSGNVIDYVVRAIIIDDIPYAVNKNDAKVFDYQFSEYLK